MLIQENDMLFYRNKNKKVCQKIRFLSFGKNLISKYGKKIIAYCYKNRAQQTKRNIIKWNTTKYLNY